MNQAERAELLEQIEKWNDADEFARCIEAIEASPERERDVYKRQVQRGQRKETRYGSRKEKGPRIRHSKGSTHLAPRNSEVDPLQRTCASTDIPSERCV